MVLLGAALLGVTVCSGSDGSSASGGTTATTAAAGAAQITTLDVPTDIVCPPDTPSTTFTVTYATTGAKKLQLVVDGRTIEGELADAATVPNVAVHCDLVPHTVVLFAYDADGQRTAEKRILNTTLAR